MTSAIEALRRHLRLDRVADLLADRVAVAPLIPSPDDWLVPTIQERAGSPCSGRYGVIAYCKDQRKPIDDLSYAAWLGDQVRIVNWRARHAKIAGVAPAAALGENRAKLAALAGLS